MKISSRYVLTATILYLLVLLIQSQELGAKPIANESATLFGRVVDKRTNQALSGATIYISDLKRGAISKSDGSFRIENLPATSVSVRISSLGYAVHVETIDLRRDSMRVFQLEESIIETHEIIVSGVSQATEKRQTPVPISTVSAEDLHDNAGATVVEALSREAGVSAVTTGSAIAKPVIRGLGANRVLVVNDGVRQEGQQWGDEHGVEVDQYSVSSAEILKGPASLSYGSDALAGVVNLLARPAMPEGKWIAQADLKTQSNNGLLSTSFSTAGHLKSIIWDMRYSNSSAHDYRNAADDYVFNSAFKEQSWSARLGLNGSWGYSQLRVNSYSMNPGIVEGVRDSLGRFLKDLRVNDTTIASVVAGSTDFLQRNPFTPSQRIKHLSVASESNLFIGDANISLILGWQQNSREEFADALQPDQSGLNLLLNTFTYDTKVTLTRDQFFDANVGVNGMVQASENRGSEFLIPDYRLFDIGIFAIAQRRFDWLQLAAGLRYDHRSQHGDEMILDKDSKRVDHSDSTTTTLFRAFDTPVQGWSASLGCSFFASDNLTLKLNLSRGYRAPNISELASNGVHDGTTRFEIGDQNLRAEQSLQTDLGISYDIEHLSCEISVFHNKVSNFIFARKLSSYSGADSLRDGFQTFRYQSGDARLYGAELSFDLHPHPLDWLHFENSLSIVYSQLANQSDSTSSLPLTPPAVFHSTLKGVFNQPISLIERLSVRVTLDYSFAQNDIYSAYGTETPTPAYLLLGMGFTAHVKIDSHFAFDLSASVSNLSDTIYQSHLSRLKYTDTNLVSGRVGVFNMGRSFDLRLSLPIDIL